MKRLCKCIMCPVGCEIEITLDNDNNVIEVKGGLCERGREFVRITGGERMQVVTTVVKLSKPIGEVRVVPVKTLNPVPVSFMKTVVSYLKNLTVDPPVKAGDVIIEEIDGKHIVVVSTRSIGNT